MHGGVFLLVLMCFWKKGIQPMIFDSMLQQTKNTRDEDVQTFI